MRKKAFTLIELIAVLVILAILSLIVTPLVMNIIRKSKDAADKRSIDAYGKSVEIAIASYVLETGFLPTDLSNLEVEYKGKTVICNIMQIKESGGIYLSECKVNNVDVKDSSTDDGWYHYGTRFISDNEYVDMYGQAIEKALEEYYDANNTYPENISSLVLNYNGKTVQATSQINPDGTVYLTNCSVAGNNIDYVYGADRSTGVKAILSKANLVEVTNYEEGNKKEMYTFEHGSTEQTGALTDYRYIGNTPNNYVYFNEELWRIVGVFEVDDGTGNMELRMKILKDTVLDSEMKWSNNNRNDWYYASLNTYLNDGYYNSISSASKEMIGSSKYYLGGFEYEDTEKNADYIYAFERSSAVYIANDTSRNSDSLTSKIGLLYPSDYVYTYAYGVDDACYNNVNMNCNKHYNYYEDSWMYCEHFNQWTISSNREYNDVVVRFDSGGYVSANGAADGQNYARPTLYLKSQVKITSGDGSEDNPYQLSL